MVATRNSSSASYRAVGDSNTVTEEPQELGSSGKRSTLTQVIPLLTLRWHTCRRSQTTGQVVWAQLIVG